MFEFKYLHREFSFTERYMRSVYFRRTRRLSPISILELLKKRMVRRSVALLVHGWRESSRTMSEWYEGTTDLL